MILHFILFLLVLKSYYYSNISVTKQLYLQYIVLKLRNSNIFI